MLLSVGNTEPKKIVLRSLGTINMLLEQRSILWQLRSPHASCISYKEFCKKKKNRNTVLNFEIKDLKYEADLTKSALITFVAKQLCRHSVACEEEGRKMTPGFEERIESTSRQIQDHYLLITCKNHDDGLLHILTGSLHGRHSKRERER